MSNAGRARRFTKRIVLGSAAGIGMAIGALFLGSGEGCSDGNACEQASGWPYGILPPMCYPNACIPTGKPCVRDDTCCSKSCSHTKCDEASGGTDAGDAGDASVDGPIEGCDGDCLPAKPDGWDQLNLVWFGPESDAPPCPDAAGVLAYEGRADRAGTRTACRASAGRRPACARCRPR